jgi:quinol monooxygenase YgiN
MTTISPTRKLVILINVFTVEPANQQKLLELLANATETSVRHAPGFISASLHRGIDGTKVTMYAQWRSVDDYQAMRENPAPLPYLQQALAIALSACFVTLSYRLASNHRWHDAAISSSEATHANSATVSATVVTSDETVPKAGDVSRGIAKEIRAAHGALQLGQWQDALENLEAAERMSPLTAFDLKTIDDFKAYAYLKLKNFKDAQSSYEAELAGPRWA